MENFNTNKNLTNWFSKLMFSRLEENKELDTWRDEPFVGIMEVAVDSISIMQSAVMREEPPDKILPIVIDLGLAVMMLADLCLLNGRNKCERCGRIVVDKDAHMGRNRCAIGNDEQTD